MDLTIGINIDGVFVDMHADDAIRGVAGIEEGGKIFVMKVDRVEANIIGAEMLENDIETFGELD